MLAIASIKGELNAAYLSSLLIAVSVTSTPPVTQAMAGKNRKKNILACNYLIVALEEPPLQVVLNSSANDPFVGWTKLISVYEPSTVEAYSEFLQEMEGCNLEE